MGMARLRPSMAPQRVDVGRGEGRKRMNDRKTQGQYYRKLGARTRQIMTTKIDGNLKLKGAAPPQHLLARWARRP